MQKNRVALIHFILLIMFMSGALLPFSASAYIGPTAPPTTLAIEGPVPPVCTTPPPYPSTCTPPGMTVITGVTPPTPGLRHICPGSDAATPDAGLTIRIIPCIRDSIVFAINAVMATFTSLFNDIFRVLFILAIVVFGISVLTGNAPSMSQSGIMLAIKIGAVVIFVNRLPPFNNIYPMMLDALEELLNIMARPAIMAFAENGPWNRVETTTAGTNVASFTCTFGTFQASETNIMEIWNLVDCYIDLLVGGIFSNANLEAGILGFILAATFSTAMGFFVGLAGLYMIATALMIIARSVYIFLTSYVAFSFMVLISSLFIPLILFQSTKRYFDAWLKLTISFLLQPVFVFGYLIMFLVAFNVTVFSGRNSLYYAIAGRDSLVTNFHIGTWMTTNGIYKEQLKVKDQVVNASTTPTVADPGTDCGDMYDTMVEDFNCTRSANAAPINTLMGNPGTVTSIGTGSVLNFFQTGIATNAIDWERLAQRARQPAINPGDPPGWDTVSGGTQAEKDKFYLDYKISILIAFMMAAIVIYIFYSLIEYLPFIGTATMGEAGVMPFGAGDLAPPGNSILGGSR